MSYQYLSAWKDDGESISTMDILVVPIIACVVSLLNVGFLATQRVLSKPKCSQEMESKLAKDKKDLEERSEYLKIHPQQLLEKEREIATHILSIAESIKVGARSFLTTEYTFMSLFVVVMFVIVGFATDDWEESGLCFIFGAFLSAACGWIGMSIAVEANVRTATAASHPENGLNDGLQVAFASGAVMGLGVTGSGILGLIVIYASIQGVWQDETRYMAGFGFGASAIALFARVGGGIYTKAADVGADLIGKVENDIPEDDPRNPATIADNVGDNVGDVAGMGADLFESFVGSVIASIQLAPQAAQWFMTNTYDVEQAYCLKTDPVCDAAFQIKEIDVKALIAIPFWIAGFGMIMSNFGVYFVRTSFACCGSHDDQQHLLLGVIRNAILATAVLAAIMTYVTCGLWVGFNADHNDVTIRIFGCTIIGLVAGIIIGQFTEYVTSFGFKPTQTIAKKSKFGEAGVIIQGLGIGMLSTAVPTVVIFIAILSCVALADTYGVAIAAVGMLSTLGVTLATDAFGPVADNAGGIAEMAELPQQTRDNTDALDALGNTTAATGKGFAIGSAVLTSLALLTAYKQDTNLGEIDVSKPTVLCGAIFGACLPYIFAALTMMAVGRAATMMIGEVRKQFEEKNLLGKYEDKPIGQPDYKACVDISTKASLYEMIIPGVLAIVAPLTIGFLLGAEALGGLLVGGITSGFMLAVYMANAGGAWDNAKKWIEAEGMGPRKGKGTKYHKAAVVGDTIGDPFKDTSGPALNILIKLMTMISLVFGRKVFSDDSAPKEAYDSPNWYVGIIIFILFCIFAIGLTLWMRAQGFGKIPDLDKDEEVEEKDNDYKASVGHSV